MKFVYFDGVGRGEQSRLLFHLAGIEYEDVRISKEKWPEEKIKAPGGQLPYLIADDGSTLSQSTAIALYVAELGQLRPSDPLLRARELEFAGCLGDSEYNGADHPAQACKLLQFEAALRPTFAIEDAAEKAQARQELLKPGGALHSKLSVLDALLSKSSMKFYVTDKPGFVDVNCLCYAQYFWRKLIDGIGPDNLEPFPALSKAANQVMDEPSIQQLYASKGGMHEYFKTGS